MLRFAPSLPFVLLLAASASILNAQAPSVTPFQGSLSELKGKTFVEAPFSIRVGDYQTVFSSVGLRFSVTNRSDAAASFDWVDLVVVGADGNQPQATIPTGFNAPNQLIASWPRRVFPGAHMDQFLIFEGVKYPARLYYKGQLLAEFTK